MHTSEKIRLVIADDHRLFVAGLLRLLSECSDLKVEATAFNGEQALDSVQRFRPDILLLDIDMPDLNAFDVLDQLSERNLSPHVIILTMHDELPCLLAASRPDIQGFVLKEAAFEELIETIQRVHAGERHVSSSLKTHTDLHGALSEREREVLRCAAQGKTTQQTATQLNISIKTVETHRSHIIKKLHVKNTTEAVHVQNFYL